ncbi:MULTISPECIES: alpha/beta fold hydrolase [unclassified Aureimonas]|uniref:alpha/beta fold hydrolase n=1 Tax=unclassified Aureimonas TaxID=2615206 RepID=UPI0006F5BAB4|nr:alpha/beta hydrolase [Aureimonas sp. Leaf427]KQT57591.1 peroxidase [Aureimonas sp. Leaf427]KQT77271.1 peroxidase [Aureimonas sp. Leaf460]
MKPAEPVAVSYRGADGNRIAGVRFGDGGAPVLLLHGAGQTRYAWTRTGGALASVGFRAIALDQRGHGESDWVADGAYAFEDFGRDALAICRAIRDESGEPPILVGASLGGIAGLIASHATESEILKALVLVDVTPSLALAGLLRIRAFMAEHLETGFASLEEAAEAVARYQPGRSRPPSLDGLSRNLRRQADGRFHWHWDPALLLSSRNVMSGGEEGAVQLRAAAAAFRAPALLVKGGASDLVTAPEVEEFLRLVPHAGFVDIADAGHMVAGDRNDVFAAAILGFLEALSPNAAKR